MQHKAELLGDIDRADILTQRVGDAGFPGAAKLPLDLLLSAEHPARDLHTERIALLLQPLPFARVGKQRNKHDLTGAKALSDFGFGNTHARCPR